MVKYKVLEVIRQGQIGGGESHLLDLVYYLDKDRIEPVCLSFSYGEMILRLKEMGIKCYVIETKRPFDWNVQHKIIELMTNLKIQIVHAHGSRAASNVIYPTKKLNLPLVYTVHGWSFHDDQSFPAKKLRAWSEKLICHYASQVICVSASNKETGSKTFGLKSAIVIENGVNLDRFNPESRFKEMRAEFGFAPDDFVVGFIARCTKQKNPLVYLDSIRIAHDQNPKIKGLFIGEGDMDNEVDAYIRFHKMYDFVYRSPFRTDVPDLLNCIDVFCLPSLWEGLSIALLEAMAMRKAIIATPTDGTKELINHERSGIIVPFDNSAAISNAVMRFYEDKPLMKSCSYAARSFVATRFNAKRVANSVLEIYSKLCE